MELFEPIPPRDLRVFVSAQRLHHARHWFRDNFYGRHPNLLVHVSVEEKLYGQDLRGRVLYDLDDGGQNTQLRINIRFRAINRGMLIQKLIDHERTEALRKIPDPAAAGESAAKRSYPFPRDATPGTRRAWAKQVRDDARPRRPDARGVGTAPDRGAAGRSRIRHFVDP